MIRALLRVLSLLPAICLLGAGGIGPASAESVGQALTAANARLAYVQSGRVWLQPVFGGARRAVPAPWPVESFTWSPDGKSIAEDDGKGRLAVVQVATGRESVLVSSPALTTHIPTVYAWSPDGGMLAYLSGLTNVRPLYVYSLQTHKARRLLWNATTSGGVPEWSHDGRRLAVEVGRSDITRGFNPVLATIDLRGRQHFLGRGANPLWSPNDALIGYVRTHSCGAAACTEDELVIPSRGIVPITLTRNITTDFDHPVWAHMEAGYAFDRWVLGPHGHIVRSLAGPHERIVSWSPDGRFVALQSFYPYQGTPQVLSISTPTAVRTRIFSTGKNAGCGACSKGGFDVGWNGSKSLMFATSAYPTPTQVSVPSSLYLYYLPTGGGATGTPFAPLDVPHSGTYSVLGFLHQMEFDYAVVQAGKVLLRYSVDSGKWSTIVPDLRNAYVPPVLDPRFVPAP